MQHRQRILLSAPAATFIEHGHPRLGLTGLQPAWKAGGRRAPGGLRPGRGVRNGIGIERIHLARFSEDLPVMTAIELLFLHLALTWALVGLIWTVQLVQYPSFALVGEAEFAAYHKYHSTRISWVVAPLMGGELLTGVALFWIGPVELSAAMLWTGLGLIALNWSWTAFVAVPIHMRLSYKADGLKRALVDANWVRTVAWSARGVWALAAVRTALPAV